jgi:hypothetical protein
MTSELTDWLAVMWSRNIYDKTGDVGVGCM